MSFNQIYINRDHEGILSVAFLVEIPKEFYNFHDKKKNPFEDLSFILVSPLCFPFCATDQTLPFLLLHESSFCLTLGYVHGFPKLEDTNALLIMGLLLDCSLYEDMKVREHESLSGFLLYYVRNVSKLSSSWQPNQKTRTQAGLMVLSSQLA